MDYPHKAGNDVFGLDAPSLSATVLFVSPILQPTDENIRKAQSVLRAGGLLGLPTETVYGLAANAYDATAISKVFEAKGRPSFNPLILHYAAAPQVDNALYNTLALEFWPGPLTMIVPKFDANVSDLAVAGLDTMAVRVPFHPVAQAVLKGLDFPVAAPSANKSGTLSPTSPMHVADSLGDAVDLILAGGACDIGLESTVVDLTGDVPVLLRHGAITKEDIERVLDCEIAVSTEENDAPKSPGQLLKHYAPDTPIRLKAIDVEKGEGLLAFGSTKFMAYRTGGRVAEDAIFNLSEQGDLYEAAANLFAMLKAMDAQNFTRIAVMDVPNTGIGIAINDRLKRAAES